MLLNVISFEGSDTKPAIPYFLSLCKHKLSTLLTAFQNIVSIPQTDSITFIFKLKGLPNTSGEGESFNSAANDSVKYTCSTKYC